MYICNSFILDKLYEEKYRTMCNIRAINVPKPINDVKLKAKNNGYFS